ncbi:MAG: ATP-binding cassette domain-containing protein [Tissierellales bacterium]|nr:ATP-binding cassette domain-containing protein [Tissierellales bacterium]
MKAWEIARDLYVNAVPVVLEEEDQTWAVLKEVSKFYDQLLSIDWASNVPGSADERKIVYLRKYEIGYVSQFLNVLPRTTAIELIENSLLEMGYEKDYSKDEACKMLSHFELDKELWDSYPVNFSGGEKLRLNVASAMIKKPRLLLLDEPTASLDLESKKKVRELIEKLKKQGTTMLGIFHDIEFMDGLCDFEFNMEKGGISPN